MLITRAIVTLVLLPIGLVAIYFGGWPFYLVILAFLMLAAIEYLLLMRQGGFQPSLVLVLAGVFALTTGRALNQLESAPFIFSALVLLAMTWHLVMFERGREQATVDFFVSIGGIVYLGWIGAYLISIRSMPDGLWWTLVVMFAVWFADTGAYLIGSRFGHTRLVPRLSPKKTWEGYIGGVLAAAIGGGLTAYVCTLVFKVQAVSVTPLRGALVGLVIGILTLFGDLGESMIKRQVGAKDSGKLLPGHGGAFDRIDSWLWAAVIGYYLITWLWI